MLLLTFMAKCDWVTLSKLGINNAVCTKGCYRFVEHETTCTKHGGKGCSRSPPFVLSCIDL